MGLRYGDMRHPGLASQRASPTRTGDDNTAFIYVDRFTGDVATHG
jgi:hypothetical protein